MADVGGLGGFGAGEFAAGGQVVEEGADFDLGAGGEANLVDVAELAGIDDDFGPGEGLRLAGAEAEAGDGGDAGDGFAAEAVGGDAVEVVAVTELAGGVALEAEEGVVAAHAGTVVGDGDEAAAAGGDLDVDLGGAGVEGVFEEFLEDGGGALDDFAGRNLVGDMLGQEADSVHEKREKEAKMYGKNTVFFESDGEKVQFRLKL